MILITSGAYVGREFQAEFGKLPPCMLPIANKPLLEHQVRALRGSFSDASIYLSLPENFSLSLRERHILDRLAIDTISVPEDLSLAESVIFALNTVGRYEGPLRLLHGDTLIETPPTEVDIVGVSRTRADYNWEVESINLTDELVWCGFFAFSDIKRLVRALTASRQRFVAAIHAYDKEIPLCRKEISHWIDVGHVNTYFQSRSRMTTERAFNKLSITGGCVLKTGDPPEKIAGEADWYARLPAALKPFTPQLIDRGTRAEGGPFYTLEYECLVPVNELYVYGRNPTFFWEAIFSHCEKWMNLCVKEASRLGAPDVTHVRESLIVHKSLERLEQYVRTEGLHSDAGTAINDRVLPSLREITETCIAAAQRVPPVPGIMHGDLCFSNVLYDSRGDRIKLVDPRGLDHSHSHVLIGDVTYDVAKLAHSVIGLYDFILAGAFDLHVEGPLRFQLTLQADDRIKAIQALFLTRSFANTAVQQVVPLTILLFLSMLPLHADSRRRQLALLANALRLYADYMVEE